MFLVLLRLVGLGAVGLLLSNVSFATGYNFNCCNEGGVATFEVINHSNAYICLRFTGDNCWSGSNDVFVPPNSTQASNNPPGTGVMACVNHSAACCSMGQGDFSMNSAYTLYAYVKPANSKYTPASCGDVIQQGRVINTVRVGYEYKVAGTIFQSNKTIHQVYWGGGAPSCNSDPDYRVCINYTGAEG